MLIRRLTIFTLFFLSTATLAEPAPYYWWVSRLDGTRICSQFLPGDGWIQEAKPFRDARCRVPL